MSPELIFQKFLLKINKGNSGRKVSIDKARFVLIINDVKHRWVANNLKKKDSILIDNLQEILKPIEVLKSKKFPTYQEFEVTDKFYEFSSIVCEAKKGNCKKTLYVREIKNQDKNILNFDLNTKPDFEYEWTFCNVLDNKVRVYTNDFEVLKINADLYREIPEFDITGYVKLDNQPSSNKEIELSDQYIDQIINLAAEEYMRDFLDANGLNISKDRTNSQE